jgi:hypothetical protein
MNTTKDYYVSDAKFLELDIDVPYVEMLKEAQQLTHRFTSHRYGEDQHNGWKSLALYGIEEDKHENWNIYGYTSALDAAKDFKWTAAAYECPTIMNFLINKFPSKRYGRVRLMLLEAGGHIAPHSDTSHRLLENINIPLSNPKECVWHWGDGTHLDMKPGTPYAMNISYVHSIENNSTEDRLHLIVARHDSTLAWKQLIERAAAKAGVTGHYITHEIAV